METISTGIEGLLLLKPKVFGDSRGYFFESYNRGVLSQAGIRADFVQDNQSLSSRGVIRGLHYQLNPHAQSKLVRALSGNIYDVAVDLRNGSPTYGKWFGIELSDGNKLQLFVPAGFAHGFSVLSDQAVVMYKTDNYYNPAAERGIAFNDSFLQVDWHVPASEVIVSERDRSLPDFAVAEKNF